VTTTLLIDPWGTWARYSCPYVLIPIGVLVRFAIEVKIYGCKARIAVASYEVLKGCFLSLDCFGRQLRERDISHGHVSLVGHTVAIVDGDQKPGSLTLYGKEIRRRFGFVWIAKVLANGLGWLVENLRKVGWLRATGENGQDDGGKAYAHESDQAIGTSWDQQCRTEWFRGVA
jgi:hypothetical protein